MSRDPHITKRTRAKQHDAQHTPQLQTMSLVGTSVAQPQPTSSTFKARFQSVQGTGMIASAVPPRMQTLWDRPRSETLKRSPSTGTRTIIERRRPYSTGDTPAVESPVLGGQQQPVLKRNNLMLKKSHVVPGDIDPGANSALNPPSCDFTPKTGNIPLVETALEYTPQYKGPGKLLPLPSGACSSSSSSSSRSNHSRYYAEPVIMSDRSDAISPTPGPLLPAPDRGDVISPPPGAVPPLPMCESPIPRKNHTNHFPATIRELPSANTAMTSVGPSPLPSSVSTPQHSCPSSPRNGRDEHSSRQTPQQIRKTTRVRLNNKKVLGKGSWGTVFVGLNEATRELIAVKEVTFNSKEEIENTAREIRVMKNLDHPRIVRYLGAERDDNTLKIYMEYVVGGSLAGLIKNYGVFTELMAQGYCIQILEGLEYLHAKNIAHRDIKCDNLLVEKNGDVKLADFGQSKDASEILKTVTGTAYFMAPEVIKGESYTLMADIWSFGCAVIEMITGRPPFSGYENQWAAMYHITNDDPALEIPEASSATCKGFLLCCLLPAPANRWPASELLGHKFLSERQESMEAVRKSAAALQLLDGLQTPPETLSQQQQELLAVPKVRMAPIDSYVQQFEAQADEHSPQQSPPHPEDAFSPRSVESKRSVTKKKDKASSEMPAPMPHGGAQVEVQDKGNALYAEIFDQLKELSDSQDKQFVVLSGPPNTISPLSSPLLCPPPVTPPALSPPALSPPISSPPPFSPTPNEGLRQTTNSRKLKREVEKEKEGDKEKEPTRRQETKSDLGHSGKSTEKKKRVPAQGADVQTSASAARASVNPSVPSVPSVPFGPFGSPGKEDRTHTPPVAPCIVQRHETPPNSNRQRQMRDRVNPGQIRAGKDGERRRSSSQEGRVLSPDPGSQPAKPTLRPKQLTPVGDPKNGKERGGPKAKRAPSPTPLSPDVPDSYLSPTSEQSMFASVVPAPIPVPTPKPTSGKPSAPTTKVALTDRSPKGRTTKLFQEKPAGSAGSPGSPPSGTGIGPAKKIASSGASEAQPTGSSQPGTESGEPAADANQAVEEGVQQSVATTEDIDNINPMESYVMDSEHQGSFANLTSISA